MVCVHTGFRTWWLMLAQSKELARTKFSTFCCDASKVARNSWREVRTPFINRLFAFACFCDGDSEEFVAHSRLGVKMFALLAAIQFRMLLGRIR